MVDPLINITRKQALIFASFLVLYEFLTYIANDMIMPGMLKVVESFHGSESDVARSLAAYIAGGASLQLILGPLSDCYGRRPVMISGALLFFACTVLIACSNSMHQFLLARFFQGTGLCFISVIGYATLQEIFAEMDAIRLIALMANVSTLAPLLGPSLGSLFIHYHFSWRIIFVIIGTFSLLALWGLWRFMPEPIGQIKRDGTEIKKIPFSVKVVFWNYGKLVINPPVIVGSIALGLLNLPCIAWIALAPIILVTLGKLSIIQYALWQLPLFGASILGNWFLQKMTHSGSVKKLILLGSIISSVGLLFSFLLPLWVNHHFIWLMPGLIVYFFGIGFTTAPFTRLILFCTPVAKGTTSALMSILVMSILVGGLEVINYLYVFHDNSIFGLYCALLGGFYFLFTYIILFFTKAAV